MKTIHRSYHAALAGALFLIGVVRVYGVGATRMYPQDIPSDVRAYILGGANPAPKATGSEGPSTAGVTFSGDLDLVTASIFTGGIQINQRAINVLVSSSLPAAKTDDAQENKYNDAQLMLPTGGVLNVLFVPWATVKVNNWAVINSGGRTIPYGRGELSDRAYLWRKPTSVGNMQKDETKAYNALGADDQPAYIAAKRLANTPEYFDTPEMRCYIFSGFGPKLINRSGDGTAGSEAKNYGIAFTAYAGLGVDGGFTGTANSGSFGNYRVETGFSGNWSDKSSIKKMYPSANAPETASTAWIGSFSMVLTGKLQTQVQWAVPLGESRDNMAKVVLIGLAMSL